MVDSSYGISSSSLELAPSPIKIKFGKLKSKRTAPKGQSIAFRQERKLKNLGVQRENVPNLPNCKLKCHLLSSKSERQIAWEEFRQIFDITKRMQFLASLIHINPPKTMKICGTFKRNYATTFYLKMSGNNNTVNDKLCKNCFMTVFNVTAAKIRRIIEKKIANGQSNNVESERGKKMPSNKITDDHIEEAQIFLLSVPVYESHYGRSRSDKLYLPNYHTKQSLFNDFKDHYSNNRVRFDKFCDIFKGLNLSIKTKSIDTCKNCDEYATLLKMSTCEVEKDKIRLQQQYHWDKWQNATKSKANDTAISKQNPSIRVIAYDLQQILPTPNLTTSVAFYSRLLSTFNLTVYDLESGRSDHYMWHEAVARRGGCEVNSCIFQYGMKLPPNVSHLIKYSDRCPGQNLNIFTIVADLYTLQNSQNLETIDSKFLVSGHTHMEVDSAHAAIERRKKKYKDTIEIPDDWYTLVGTTSTKFNVHQMQPDYFLDFSEVLKRELVYRKKDNKSSWKFENIQWIRVKKDSPGKFFYKTSYDENENFKEVSLIRKKGVNNVQFTVNPLYEAQSQIPVTQEKKNDLLSLLKFIKPCNHKFYENLQTSN